MHAPLPRPILRHRSTLQRPGRPRRGTFVAAALGIWLCAGALFGDEADFSIDVRPLADGVYLVHSYGTYQGQKTEANGLVVQSGDCVALLDTAWGEGQTRQLLEWVRSTLHRPVSFAVITHAHADRIGGIAVLHAAGIETYAGARTAAAAKAGGFAAPRHLFDREDTLRCGAVRLELFYPGPGHTVDNTTVYVPERRLLYGGCFLKSAASTSLGNVADADLAAWPASLTALERRFPDAELVVPGHGGLEAGALANTRRLLEHPAAPKP